MARSKFETIPAEIREAIFNIIFRKSKVYVGRTVTCTSNEIYFHKDFDDNILYTSKLLYNEARPILASSLNIRISKNSALDCQEVRQRLLLSSDQEVDCLVVHWIRLC